VVPGSSGRATPALGKRSTRLFSFQAFRQAVGILLIGTGERTRAGFEAKADAALVGDKRDEAKKKVLSTLNLLADTMPGFKEIIAGTMDVPTFRERYLHSTAVGLYALCLAMHHNAEQDGDSGVAAQALADLDWRRDPSVPFGRQHPGGLGSEGKHPQDWCWPHRVGSCLRRSVLEGHRAGHRAGLVVL
jgi:hypothetical protein